MAHLTDIEALATAEYARLSLTRFARATQLATDIMHRPPAHEYCNVLRCCIATLEHADRRDANNAAVRMRNAHATRRTEMNRRAKEDADVNRAVAMQPHAWERAA